MIRERRIERGAVGIGDRPPEPGQPCRDRAADASEAKYSEPPPGHLAGERTLAAGPQTGADMRVALRNAPQQPEQQADGQVRDIVGQHVRRVGHPHAPRLRVVEIDAIEAHAVDGDDADAGQRGQRRRVDAEMAAGQHRAHPAAVRGEPRCALRLFVEAIDGEARVEFRGHERLDGNELQKIGLVHQSTASTPPST